MIRIVCGGVFDRFPMLQFIIGHMGEGLPFFFQRLDIIPMTTTKLKRPIGGFDRIMFSADYPYQSMPQARAFLEQIPATDGPSTEDPPRIGQ